MRLSFVGVPLGVAALLGSTAVLAQAPGGAGYPASASIQTSGVPSRDCVPGAMEGLVEAGWKIRKPAAGALAFQAEFASPASTVLVDCEYRVVVGATHDPADAATRDRQLEAAAQSIRNRLAGSWDFASKRYMWRRPLTGATPAWLSTPPRLAVVLHRAPYKDIYTRCVDAARIGLEDKGFKISGKAIEAPSGTKAIVVDCNGQHDGMSTALIAAVSAPDKLQATAADLARIGNAIGEAEPLAPRAPDASVKATEVSTSSAHCLAKAQAELTANSFTVRRFAGGVTGRKDDQERTFFCLADGAAGGMDSFGTDVFTTLANFREPGWTPAGAGPGAVLTGVSGRSGAMLVPHELEGGDCNLVADPALASAGYLASGERLRHAGKATYDCLSGAVMFVVYAEPAGGLTPGAELAAIAGRWQEALRNPHWSNWNIEPLANRRQRNAYVQFPFRPRTREVPTAAGPRQVSTARYRGVTFQAWVQPVFPGLSDDEQLDKVVEQVTGEGVAIRDTRKASYASSPSVAVWGSRAGAAGEMLRSVARYTVRQGQVYATEVIYPEGVDVAEDLTRFADSLSL